MSFLKLNHEKTQFEYIYRMACGQCSTGGCGNIKVIDKNDPESKSGCSSGGCSTGGCNKMNSFDWLSNMELPKNGAFQIVEIKFKGGRKEFFKNKNKLDLYTGDFVVCEMPNGYHIGSVSLQGDLVRLQMSKKNIKESDEIPNILRKASEKDLEKHNQAINRDLPAMYRTREICKDLKLNLKLSEVEFQSDNSKATFFYSAEDRVDFRELIKLLAAEFKVRIEMRQISLRQEAGRIGGIGSCGRELCCSTWLNDFKAIPTAAARYQNLSLNPAKLSGQCGRLKCCLNYELETYIDAIKDIPTVERPLQTEKGEATIQKTDIFRRIMWFSYPNETNWYPITCSQVAEIQKMNLEGKKPVGLENLMEIAELELAKPVSINNDLERLDKKYHNKKKPNKNNGNKGNANSSQIQASNQANGNQKPQGNRPNNQNGNKPVNKQANLPTNKPIEQAAKPVQAPKSEAVQHENIVQNKAEGAQEVNKNKNKKRKKNRFNNNRPKPEGGSTPNAQ